MIIRIAGGRLAALILGTLTAAASAAPVEIDVGNSQNGIFDIYSATFDPPLVPCSGGSPVYCSFFGGDPPATRQLVITPNPTTVTTGPPAGIATPPDAAFLDVTLSNNNTSLTLAGGSLKFPVLVITIIGQPGTADDTVVTATNAGFVFNAAPQTAAVDANGRAEFLVTLAPAIAVDFSTFSVVVTSCTGPLCALIPILTLDMIRYRLVIDYDANFGSFTGNFLGQTANNSIVFANLHSGVPEIAVTDTLAPVDDLKLLFGDVTELTSATETVTVTNTGGGHLFLGDVAQLDPLAAPYSLASDGCSGQTLSLAETCTIDIDFSPGFVGDFPDSMDIPSNDADEPAVMVEMSGFGVTNQVPNIVVTDSVTPDSDLRVPFGNVIQGGFADQTVTVTNSGTGNLLIGQIAMANPLLAPFSVQADTCSNRTLTPTDSCSFGVRFEPTAPGFVSQDLDIPSNDADTPAALVNVNGTGAQLFPDIRITDPTTPDDDRDLTFDEVRASGSFDRIITVSNIGTADLVIQDIAQANPLAAPFSVVAGEDDCSGRTLAPNENCSFRLRFEPTEILFYDDDFDVPSNDPDEPTVLVSVAGDGVESPTAPPTPTPEGSDSGFMAIDPAMLLLLGAAGAYGRKRRRGTSLQTDSPRAGDTTRC